MSTCPSHRCMCVPLSIPSHYLMGHSMGCPPVSLTDVHVFSCPFHLTIPWDLGTFHGMSTCLSHRSTVHPIPLSHGTIGHSTGCLPVPLTDACVSHCPSHPTIPWDQGTFHGMSTCPSHRCACILFLSQKRVYPIVHFIPRSNGTMGHSIECPPVPLIEARVPYCPSHPMGPWDIPRDVHLSLSQMHVCPTVHPIPRSHGIVGHSTGCPPVPLTDARVSSCPSHPTIPWDHGTFHWMSTCPSHISACTLLSIPSHGTMGHSMGCPPVPLTDTCVSHCPSHFTIPWDHGTFHGISTYPSHRCACILLFIPSHNPMGPWDIPWDVHLSLSQKRVYPTVHSTIPWDHGTFHGMSTCPAHRSGCILLSIPSHDPMGSWDMPWDVHLFLSQKRVNPLVHPIPRSNGTMGYSMGCPPVRLTDACV